MRIVRIVRRSFRLQSLCVALVFGAVSCGAGVLNPAFVNTVGGGGAFPITPGPGADFVLVRVLNETSQVATFFVTVWSDVLEVDDSGEVVVKTKKQNLRVDTGSVAPANDTGVLFKCSESAVNVVGLGGVDLLNADGAVCVGGQGAGGALGNCILTQEVPPLRRELGHFACGDTIVFRAFASFGAAGGVKVESWVWSGSQQPSIFSGRSTFENYQIFIESQVREDE